MKNFFKHSFFNVLNRILGFLRTILFYKYVPKNISDGFFQTDFFFSIFRRIFMDGNFEAVFINYYNRADNKKVFAGSVFINFGFIVSGLFIISMVFIEKIALFLSKQEEIFPLIKSFLLFLFINEILFFLMGFFIALLNAEKRFITSSASPFIGNIFNILILVLLAKLNNFIFITVCCSQLAYSIVQVIIMFFSTRDLIAFKGFYIPFKFLFDILQNSLSEIYIVFIEFFATSSILKNELGTGFLATLKSVEKITGFVYYILAVSITSVLNPKLAAIKNNALKVTEENKNIPDIFLPDLYSEVFLFAHLLAIIPTLFLLIFGQDLILSVLHISQINSDNLNLLGNLFSLSCFTIYFYIQNKVFNMIFINNNRLKNIIISSVLSYSLYGLFVFILSHTIMFNFSNKTLLLIYAKNFMVLFQFIIMLILAFYKKILILNLRNLLLYSLITVIYSAFFILLKFFVILPLFSLIIFVLLYIFSIFFSSKFIFRKDLMS